MLLFTQCTSDVDKMNKYVLFEYKNRIQTWCKYMANDIYEGRIELKIGNAAFKMMLMV